MILRKWLDRYSVDCDLKYNSKKTRKNYKSGVALFLSVFQSYSEPKEIPTMEIKEWLLSFESINTRNHKLCAIKSFYELTAGMPVKIDKIPFSKKDKKLPIPLDISEIQDLRSVCLNTKHRIIIGLLYGCGLRIGELLNLKQDHIDKRRMIVNIVAGKGNKDRQIMLDDELLKEIEAYYQEYSPIEYVFNGQNNSLQYSERSVNEFLKTYANKAGITKKVHAHILRHSFATHLLEDNTDISIIQKLLGHSSPKTTQIYAHISTNLISKVRSPFKNL